MKKTILATAVLWCLSALCGVARADKSKTVLFVGGTTCAANGTTTQIFGYEPTRTEYLLFNSSNQDVYLIYNSTGGHPTSFTSTNAILFKSGSAISDSGNNVYIGYGFCQSTSTISAVISVGDFAQ